MTEDVVIRAEGLGKKYAIGHLIERERYGALRDVLVRGAHNIWHKTADLVRGRPIVAGDSIEEFWALKDISFEVKRGEVLGVIGRNGAGKSTLLKILSRITEPTEGRVMINGRVASLLEVGTGFHPELTGRENIYLNGTILGMSRAEIRRKFDEIVAFAEVETFLDTPTKRYSSGMYVRLAFAVAAHLDPEILIVDEVLAVGDAEFQKKCLGKMSNVASGGRTVLFVSHNMTAIENLCRSCVALQSGKVFARGPTVDVLNAYLGSRQTVKGEVDLTSILADRDGGGPLRFARMRIMDERGIVIDRPRAGQSVEIQLAFSGDDSTRKAARISVAFATYRGHTLFICNNEAAQKDIMSIGAHDAVILKIPEFPLSAGTYLLRLYLERGGVIEDWIKDLELEVADGNFFGSGRNTPPSWEGRLVLVRHSWKFSDAVKNDFSLHSSSLV
jgi:lipopolysaccharide transport system ATP-binding protein